MVVDEGEIRAGDNQGLRLQGLGLGVPEYGSGASGDASVRRPPSRRRRRRSRRRAGRVRGDAMPVRGSYQLWGNLEENPRMGKSEGRLRTGVWARAGAFPPAVWRHGGRRGREWGAKK